MEREAERQSPEAVIAAFGRRLGKGDLVGLMDLYADEAAYVPEAGRVASGREEIEAALAPLIALRPRIETRIVRVVRAGSIALVANRWTLVARQPDGGELRLGGTSADVLRREADGAWRIVIDDPWGAAAGDGM
jgi:uncharacterized protein (TIGR02246 family)